MSPISSQITRLFTQPLFRQRSKKTSKLRVTGLCEGNSPVTGEFSSQMASNAEKSFHLMTSSWMSSMLQVFKETEYRKTITIPIINDNQYEADVDFYVILKNPQGDAGLSDPNITRVTIIDDDGR